MVRWEDFSTIVMVPGLRVLLVEPVACFAALGSLLRIFLGIGVDALLAGAVLGEVILKRLTEMILHSFLDLWPYLKNSLQNSSFPSVRISHE